MPGSRVYVNEISCGALPCGAGPQVGFHEVIVTGDGSFLVMVRLSSEFIPLPGVTWRLIAAYGADWSQAQIDAAPTVRVPVSHPGNVSPPETGTGSAVEDTSLQPNALAGSMLMISGIGAMVLFGVKRRIRH